MPRRLRHAAGGYVYHVLNRAVARATLFDKPGDYLAFAKVLRQVQDWLPVPLLTYCIMPNHWHLVFWPRQDGVLSEPLPWLTVPFPAFLSHLAHQQLHCVRLIRMVLPSRRNWNCWSKYSDSRNGFCLAL